MRKAVCLFIGFCATEFTIACARNDPPGIRATSPATNHGIHVSADSSGAVNVATDGTTAMVPSAGAFPSPTAVPLAGPFPSPTAVAPASTATGAATPAPASERHQDPPLFDAAGQPLPQTDERPESGSASFQWRMSQLCQAIIEGVPAQAHPAFFPAVAYAQVKAVADPERDYRLRLLSHFDRDILDYHRRISRRPGPCRCGGTTVPDNLARWMKPGSEYNKLGYFRLLRSHIDIVDAAEKTISLEVTSLISWRGQWYVVHLNGFE